MKEFTKIDIRFSLYFSAVALLHVAHKISKKNSFGNKFIDILEKVIGCKSSHFCGVFST